MDEAIVRAVAGLRGFGKTSRVLELTRNEPRVLFYDSLGDDYSEGVVCRSLAVLEKLWHRSYRGPFRLSYKPVDPIADVARICELAYACGDMLLVVDEIQLYFRGQWCSPELTKVITGGRHVGLGLIGVTQAPKRLGELLRSQAREWFVFAMREPDHVKYLTDRLVGVDPAHILMLDRWEYLHYVDGWDNYELCIDDLATHTVNVKAAITPFRPGGSDGSQDSTPPAESAGDAPAG
jgi:hypothetical protein